MLSVETFTLENSSQPSPLWRFRRHAQGFAICHFRLNDRRRWRSTQSTLRRLFAAYLIDSHLRKSSDLPLIRNSHIQSSRMLPTPFSRHLLSALKLFTHQSQLTAPLVRQITRRTMASAMAKRLEGKTIVVTGASSGIGKSTGAYHHVDPQPAKR